MGAWWNENAHIVEIALGLVINGLLHIGGLTHIHKSLYVDSGIFIKYTVEIAGKSISYFRANLAAKLWCVFNVARCTIL